MTVRPNGAAAPDVVIGLMSGTSLDGVTAAVVRFTEQDSHIRTELLAWLTHPYSEAQRAALAEALTAAPPAKYCRVNFDLGGWLADATVAAIAEAGVARPEIALVASHGQTIWHEPGHSTWQLGESAVIAERTGLDVVSDFRVRDIAAGGQGAPLVSIADALLFADDREWRALQNIGGIGNVTIVPPNGDLRSVRAFDTGPGVGLIDTLARRADPSLPYDVDGRIARAGRACPDVVDTLLAAPYFAAEPPKSTGRELFSAAYASDLAERCAASRPGATPADVVATATLLTARSIADAYRRFLPEPANDVLLSGGGARNPALVAAIRAEMPGRKIRAFDDVFFDGEAKEAVAFALLGWLFHQRRTGNVPTATGARGARILGKLTPA